MPSEYCAGRRAFLKATCGVTTGLLAGGRTVAGTSEVVAMPRVRIGSHLVSRLVLGANPLWGYSYQGELMSKFMANHFNDDNILKLLHQSERAGIENSAHDI